MKNNFFYLVFFIAALCSCKKGEPIDNPKPEPPIIVPIVNPPVNNYSNYNFYIADEGCAQNNAFTKNFKPIAGFGKAESFNIIGNTIYTYGTKQYRFADPKSPNYVTGSNYGGYLNINGAEKYGDQGGLSQAVIGLQEVGSDVYFLTGQVFLDGGMSVEQAMVIQLPSKVYKNGTVLYDLSGPFNNHYQKSGQTINNYKSLVFVKDMIIKGSNIYISGGCENGKNSDQVSFGYWKNGVYNELKRAIDRSLVNWFKFFVSDNGDIYYGFNNGGVNLFKNGTDLFNGSLANKILRDFDVLNNDIYLLVEYYENGNRFGILKNGVLEYSCPVSNSYDDYKIQVLDNKIFICGAGIELNEKTTVFEYKPSTKTLVKVGSTGTDYNCTVIRILDFQVTKN